MSIVLTQEQQQALDQTDERPTRIIDPRTNLAHVLVKEQDFESVREALEEEERNRVIHRIALQNAIGRMNCLAHAPRCT